jgi:hypothetical protein
MKKIISLLALSMFACGPDAKSSDVKQQEQQESILQDATSSVGMPAIKNFRERRLLKMILEMRDKEISTYTYIPSMDSKLVFLCNSVGYGIPYATQYTSPEKMQYYSRAGGYTYERMPQADPNALFSPASADGTWVMCKDPNGGDVKPVFIEPRIVVSPFPLDKKEVVETEKK